MFFAAESGRTELVKYLLEHGARVDVRDDAGKTPADVATGSGEGRTEARAREIVALLQGVATTGN